MLKPLEDIDEIGADCPPKFAPLVVAARAGMGFFVAPDGTDVRAPIHRAGTASVFILGDELPGGSASARFKAAELAQFLPSCGSVLLLTTEAPVQLYAAVAMAVMAGIIEGSPRPNIVIVETLAAREAEWVSFLATAVGDDGPVVILGTHVAGNA